MIKKTLILSTVCLLGVCPLSYAMQDNKDDKDKTTHTPPKTPQNQGQQGDKKGGDQKGQNNVVINKDINCIVN